MLNDIIYLTIKKFMDIWRRPLDGRKKLQKLLFILEYMDLNRRVVRRRKGIVPAKFIIWHYGPFSSDIVDTLDNMVEEGYVAEECIPFEEYDRLRQYLKLYPFYYLTLSDYEDEGAPYRIFIYSVKRERRVQRIKELEKVIRMYGDLSPKYLEAYVCWKLNLTPEKKLVHLGVDVDEYIEKYLWE